MNLHLKSLMKFSILYNQIVFSKLTLTILKFIYSEKATKVCEISTNYLSYVCTASQIIGGDFAKFCGLLRIYELYKITFWLS